MATRRTKKVVTSNDSAMAQAVRNSRGDEASHMAVEDYAVENNLVDSGNLLLTDFTVGQGLWLETPRWVYVGRILFVGIDYIALGEAQRMPTDGRHHVMMRTGTAPGIGWEATGGKNQVMRIPADWIGPCCDWHHVIPGFDQKRYETELNRDYARKLINEFVVGKKFWMETPRWVYVGRTSFQGIDYIKIDQCSRMPTDGRHNVMMRTGTAPGIEWEPTGGRDREMRMPIDWIGPCCDWDHPIPEDAV